MPQRTTDDSSICTNRDGNTGPTANCARARSRSVFPSFVSRKKKDSTRDDRWSLSIVRARIAREQRPTLCGIQRARLRSSRAKKRKSRRKRKQRRGKLESRVNVSREPTHVIPRLRLANCVFRSAAYVDRASLRIHDTGYFVSWLSSVS